MLTGGVDAESVENAKIRGPLSLRSGDRAVTVEDFERLTQQASPAVGRARCLVVGLLTGQSVVAGAMDVLLVIIALDLLDLPPSAAGYLTAARGAGGLFGGLWSMGLMG